MIKAILLDVFDTVLMSRNKYESPYTYILKQLNFDNVLQTLRQDRILLLEKETDFAQYLDKHAPQEMPQNCRDKILSGARELFKRHRNDISVRTNWWGFNTIAEHYELKVAMASNLASPYTQIVDEKLADVSHKFYSCAMGLSKPHPKFFQQACDVLQVAPQEVVMIGNSFSSDMQGAQLAGLGAALWLPTADTKNPASETVHRINDLMDVFPTLRQQGLLPS